ncbi:hypothetical protein JYU34_010034 [Plutella xylostella]|uniref:Uncharacterized protein n=1 Tax=Plutella xylostella TaxID=51655 RepID=A0ABQ7QL73_PLUXY|nr:hypothetical protein JYU34_010034 [Plutella xylostella]
MSDNSELRVESFQVDQPRKNKSYLLTLLVYIGVSGCLAAIVSIPRAALNKALGEAFYGIPRRSRFDTILDIIHTSVGTVASLVWTRCISAPHRRLVVAQIGLTASTTWLACQYSAWRPTSDWSAYVPHFLINCFGSVFLADTSVHDLARRLHSDTRGLYVTQTWVKFVKLISVAGTHMLLSLTPDVWHPKTTVAAAVISVVLLAFLIVQSIRGLFTEDQVEQPMSCDDAGGGPAGGVGGARRELAACALAAAAVALFTGQRAATKFTYYMYRDVLSFTDGHIRLIIGLQFMAFSASLAFSAHIQKLRPNSTPALLVSGIVIGVISRGMCIFVYPGTLPVGTATVLVYVSLVFSAFGPVPEPILRTEALGGWRAAALVQYAGLAMILADRGGSLLIEPTYYALVTYVNANPFTLTVALLILAYASNRISKKIK